MSKATLQGAENMALYFLKLSQSVYWPHIGMKGLMALFLVEPNAISM